MYKTIYKSPEVSPHFDSTSISLMIRNTGKKGAKILQTQPSKEGKAHNLTTLEITQTQTLILLLQKVI